MKLSEAIAAAKARKESGLPCALDAAKEYDGPRCSDHPEIYGGEPKPKLSIWQRIKRWVR